MINYAFRELIRRKRRTVAHTAGYALAAAVITLILIVLLNGRAASDAVLSGTGTHFMAFVNLCNNEACSNYLLDAEHESFYGMNTRARILPYAALELVRTLETVADASFFLLFKLHQTGAQGGDVLLGGVPLPVPKSVATNSCSPKDVIEGRFLAAKDENAVMLEEAFARSRYLKAGDTLSLAGKEYAVAGIVNPGIRIAKADVYLPYAQARNIINTRLAIPIDREANLILVETRNAFVHAQAMEQVKKILGSGGNISSYGCYKPASQAMGITGASAFLITLTIFICLLAVSLQAQYGSVAERRYDIGILKSIGWSRKQILVQVLWESLLKAGAGWFVGSLIAVIVFAFIPSQALMGTQTQAVKQLYPSVLFVTLILAVFSGLFAGALPGFFASSRRPAECLRRL